MTLKPTVDEIHSLPGGYGELHIHIHLEKNGEDYESARESDFLASEIVAAMKWQDVSQLALERQQFASAVDAEKNVTYFVLKIIEETLRAAGS